MPNMRIARPCWILAFGLLLAGCGSDGPVKHVFPPRASIQQLTIEADGGWKLQLRVQNYSSISETFAKVDAKVEVAGNAAGNISVSPAIRIGPSSADVVEASLVPTPAARQAVASLRSGNVSYKLVGHIVTSDPVGDNEYTFEGVLSPVPGLPGVLR
jgi:hypothetical protein